MKAPNFWNYGRTSLRASLLSPLAFIYNAATIQRANQPARWKAPVPVICIGNLIMGGAGKTPTALSIAQFLKEDGKNPFFLSRGYGGQLQSPLMVKEQTSEQVGDEPLLLNQIAPVCVSKDRIKGAQLCVEQGCDVIIMDDGFQNPYLHKDLSLLVVDGGYGHGNEKTFPAGPLRETLSNGLKRAQGLVIIGTDKTKTADRVAQLAPNLPLLQASIIPTEQLDIKAQKVVAFAGIGRPEKFFETVQELGADIRETCHFPDHHAFTSLDLKTLKARAQKHQARLITTEKDWVRLPKEIQQDIDAIKISLAWDKPDMLKPLLSSLFV